MIRKLMIAGAALVCVSAGPLKAADPMMGCFMRDYSDAHLAKHPAQVVDEIALSVRQAGEFINGTLWVLTARQGHVAHSGLGGRLLKQQLLCWKEMGTMNCFVECDGGGFTVTKATGDSLTFRTNFLLVGDENGCGGPVDLAENPGQPVSYRLNRADPTVCGVE